MHVAIAHAQPDHQAVQRFGVSHRFFCTVNTGFGDDFEQRRACAVQVDATFFVKQFVGGFACVFFKVSACQLYGFFVGFVFLAHIETQCATDDHGQLKLADLIAFGQIGIKVVFTGKNRNGCDFSVDRQTKSNCFFNRSFVEHGQNTRQGQINGAGLGIGFCTVSG